MIINAIWLSVITIVILSEIYLLSKYISKKNEMFVENKFGSFVTGMIVYLFITLIALFPFIWMKVSILYLVIVFCIKEGVTFVFLISRDNKHFKNSMFKEYLTVILGALLVTIIWNYGIVYLIEPIEKGSSNRFSTIFTFNDIISRISKFDINIIKMWISTLFVSIIGFGSILALMKEYSYSFTWVGKLFGFFLMLSTTILFSFKLPLWQNGETFIAIFILLICSRIITLSRRRYGILFTMAAFASFSFGGHLRIGLWGIAIVTSIIYTFLKKPQNSLFWVMLISPLLIIEALNAYKISGILSTILAVISIVLFIFMLSLQGVAPLRKLNAFFEKYRILTPFMISATLLTAAISVIIVKDIEWENLSTINNSVIYQIAENSIYKWVNLSVFYLIISALIFHLSSNLLQKKPFARIDYIYIMALLMIFIVFNPLMDALLSKTIFKGSIQYVSAFIFPPLFILSITQMIQIKKQHIN